MDDEIADVTVVGGGDVGLLTALSIRQVNPDVRVRVVDDFQREIPQVGKSTYREIQQLLHGSLGIDESRFISEVKPVWKASVYFRDWCGRPEFHYPFDPPDKYPSAGTPNALEHYYYLYEEAHASPDHLTRCEAIVDHASSPWFYGPNGDLDRYDKVAYHLDTERFNTFLRTLCRERGISLVDDEIVDVETDGNRIVTIRSRGQQYESDLYVDATGFSRVLRSEQDVAFRDFGFPLDSALNVRIDRGLADVIPATIVESGDHGWFWHIDTYDDRDLGYVYASDYVSDEDALDEFRAYVDSVDPAAPSAGASGGAGSVLDADDVDHYEFTAGYFEQAWVENCLAIGNAEGFVEPLQSTALTANTSLAVQFANLLSSRGQRVDDDARDAYNTAVSRTWESIHDFVGVHYSYSTGDTPFWRDVGGMHVSDRVGRIDAAFDRYGYDWTVDIPDDEGFADLKVFSLPDFYTIMRNLGVDSAFYESLDVTVSDDVERSETERYRQIRDQVATNHLTTRELYQGVLNF